MNAKRVSNFSLRVAHFGEKAVPKIVFVTEYRARPTHEPESTHKLALSLDEAIELRNELDVKIDLLKKL